MSDLVERLRAMPSSYNDACRAMDKAADRIEALEAALRGAEQDWVAGEVKLLKRIKEMLGQETMGLPAYSRKHIMDEIDLAIAALAPEQDK